MSQKQLTRAAIRERPLCGRAEGFPPPQRAYQATETPTISATFAGAFIKPLVSGKNPFEELSSARGALKSAFSRYNSLVSSLLTVQAACDIQGVSRSSGGAERLWTSLARK